MSILPRPDQALLLKRYVDFGAQPKAAFTLRLTEEL